MTVLVLGATGQTGRWVVRHLLANQVQVKVIVRSKEKFHGIVEENLGLLAVIEDSIMDMTIQDFSDHLRTCDGVISCLGHNLTFKGIFGPPHRLVTKAIIKVCESLMTMERPGVPVKVVLMNTTGNINRDMDEKVSVGHRMVLGILRLLLPPHKDNEEAADYLRTVIGQKNEAISWVAVRPDGLVDEDKVTKYSVHPSPIRDSIFDAGTTSRINAAHLMARLMTDKVLWRSWEGQMPVIYNEEE